MPFAMKGNHERFLADATIYMTFFSNIILAWQWLKIATTAKKELLIGSTTFQPEFYESKLLTMKFFFKYELTQNKGLAEVIRHPEIHTLVEDREMIF